MACVRTCISDGKALQGFRRIMVVQEMRLDVVIFGPNPILLEFVLL